jgi:hypothetical protein
MPTDLSTIDLATINAAQGVIVAAIRNQCCQWEQESADAVADGRLSNALMLEHWASSAEHLSAIVSSEFSAFFAQAFTARFGDLASSTHRSPAEQGMDALALEVATAQEAPELIAA